MEDHLFLNKDNDDNDTGFLLGFLNEQVSPVY